MTETIWEDCVVENGEHEGYLCDVVVEVEDREIYLTVCERHFRMMA